VDPDSTQHGRAVAEAPSLAVVIPFHGRRDLLDACLDSVADLRPAPDEVIVVADGEDPARLRSVADRGFRLLHIAPRAGAAAARNIGAAASAAEVVLFVDADVVVPPDAVARVRRVLGARPGLAAVFGSYDDVPAAPGQVSRFKNLLHHWTHQRSAAIATTFWTGCGAVRRAVFTALGGFDPEQRWLEDVELGYRLRAAGHHVELDHSLQVTHLKRWTLPSLIVSDIFHRALPWSEITVRYRRPPRDLNGDLRGRVSVACAAAVPLFLAAAAVVEPWLAVGAAVAVGALIVVNRGFYRLLSASGGLRLAAVGLVLHWLSLLAGGSAYALGMLWWRVAGTRRPATRAPLLDRSAQDDRNDGPDQPAAPDGGGAESSMPRRRRRTA